MTWLKNCSLLRFSYLGAYFIGINRSTKSYLSKLTIIDSLHFQQLHSINWHSGKTLRLIFSNFDSSITSCSNDGTILSFHLSSQTKEELLCEKEIELLDLQELSTFPVKCDESTDHNNISFICLGRDLTDSHFLFIKKRNDKQIKKIWINFAVELKRNSQLRIDKFIFLRRNRHFSQNDKLNLDIFKKEDNDEVLDLIFFDREGHLIECKNALVEKNISLIYVSHTLDRILEVEHSHTNKVFLSSADGSLSIWKIEDCHYLSEVSLI